MTAYLLPLGYLLLSGYSLTTSAAPAGVALVAAFAIVVAVVRRYSRSGRAPSPAGRGVATGVR